MKVFYALGTLLLFLQLKINVSVGLETCTEGCNCSSQYVPILGKIKYFVLDCFGEDLDVTNVSQADVFYYKAPEYSRSKAGFDSNLLHDFTHLKSLHLDGGLQALKFIPKISSLKVLNITHTPISFLLSYEASAISQIMIQLFLGFNNIAYINDDAFSRLDTLLYLNLSHNKLNKVPSKAMSSLKNLKELDLSFNLLRNVMHSDFIDLQYLTLLNLDGNSLYSLAYINFSNSDMTLLVRNNPLIELSWHATATNAKLQRLDISGNRLTVLQPQTFVNAYFETLTITNCELLQLIAPDVFVNTTVVDIKLSHNPRLQFIDTDAFQNVHRLVTIDVSFNNLRIIPQGWSELPEIKRIVAMGNPLLCDCNMAWISEIQSSGTKERIEVIISSPTATTTPLECSSRGTMSDMIPEEECPPRLVYRSRNVTTIDEGEEATLRCKFGGVPTPTIQWRYGSRSIPSDTNIKIEHNNLLLTQARSRNSGVYQCMAKNAKGLVQEAFNVVIVKDNSKIMILSTGKDYVEFSWKVSYQIKRYKAILIDVKNNSQKSYAIHQYTRSRHSPNGYTIANLQSDTTYRVCLAYQSQTRADSAKCETFTTSEAVTNTSSGITDYSLYGIIVATLVSIIFICIIVCVCISSRNYSRRKKKEMRDGMASESTFGLMTASFSQRSGMSSMYDNSGVSITPISHLSMASSCYKARPTAISELHTPTSTTVCFSPALIQYDEGTGSIRNLKRTVSDPLLSIATQY